MPTELDPLDFDVLDHVARYKLGVPEALARSASFAGRSLGQVKATLKRLRAAGYLKPAPLYGDRSYDYLTADGEAAIGIGIGSPDDGPGRPRRGGALSEVAKVRAYALLSFCCLADRPRQRLTAAEFQLGFADHHRPGLPMSHYADVQAGRLGFARVDAGGHGRWDRIVERVRHDVDRHRAIPAFAASIASGSFELTVITATGRKAEQLRAAVAEFSAETEVPVLVHVVPDLIELIAPPPKRARRPPGCQPQLPGSPPAAS